MPEDLITVLATLGLYAGLVVSPGPGFALVSRLALSGARAEAFTCTLGFAVGATFYAVLSMTGLALMIQRMGSLVDLIQIAGGCYLVWFGLCAWGNKPAPEAERPTHTTNKAWRGFRTGLLVDLSNPKGIAFFVSLYAVAIPADTALWAKTAIVAGGFVLELGWYNMAAATLATPPAQRVYRRFAGVIERCIGTVLAAFGLRLIAEKTL
ncbi:RhtB family transporter [Salinisphaera dokdonensis CL-ES53]|uniref:RhtB family transporter n=1 Tax=Salinisphaera dokdonensis CL-ES53 TaxID=1304272 RepID=A0ABV2AWP1_9GAMM